MLRASSSIYLQQLWQRPSSQTTDIQPAERGQQQQQQQKSSLNAQDDNDLNVSSLDFPPPPIPPKHGDHTSNDDDYDDLNIMVLHPEPGIAGFHHTHTPGAAAPGGRRQTKTYHFLYQDGVGSNNSSSSSAGTASLPPTPTLAGPAPAPSQSADIITPKVGLLRRESSRLSLKRKNLTRKLKRAMSFSKSSSPATTRRPSSTET